MTSLPDLAFDFSRKGTAPRLRHAGAGLKSVADKMLPLPLPGFNPGARRALFIGAQWIAVYHWEGNDVGPPSLFDAGEDGRRRFRRYLAETPDLPFYALVDLADEEYRRETIPRLARRDRRALLKRKAARLFKDASYWRYEVTGRETGGAGHDRVLLSALANPSVLRQWLALLEEAKTPLAGICSLPLFTQTLLQSGAGRDDGQRLLVSLQSVSGLRQTLFVNGEFRFSRLARPPEADPASFAPFIREEVEKIRRYLNSQRPLAAGEPLHIHFLLAGKLLRELQSGYARQESVSYHFCDLDELAAESVSRAKTYFRMLPHKKEIRREHALRHSAPPVRPSGLRRDDDCPESAARGPDSSPFSDRYFMQQLLRTRPRNGYAAPAERRYFHLRRLRAALAVAAIALLLGSAGWGGLNFLGGMAFKRRSDVAQEQAHGYAAQYEQARKRLPETPVEPADLAAAVRIADSLARYKSSPIDVVAALSRSLDGFPAIQVSKLAWAAVNDPETAFDDAPPRAGIRVALDGSRAAGARYHAALLEGRIEPFNGNFRAAMETVERFAEDLRAREGVRAVTIVALPLDTSSGADLQGNTQSLQRRAQFTLRVILERAHET